MSARMLYGRRSGGSGSLRTQDWSVFASTSFDLLTFIVNLGGLCCTLISIWYLHHTTHMASMDDHKYLHDNFIHKNWQFIETCEEFRKSNINVDNEIHDKLLNRQNRKIYWIRDVVNSTFILCSHLLRKHWDVCKQMEAINAKGARSASGLHITIKGEMSGSGEQCYRQVLQLFRRMVTWLW